MTKTEIYRVFLGLFICGIRCSGMAHSPPSDSITLIPLSAYVCEDFDSPNIIEIQLRNVDNDRIVMDTDATFDDKFTDKWILEVKVDKWNNGGWDENFYNSVGSTCSILNQFIEKIWDKIRKETSPLMEEKCEIEAGSYTLRDFEVSRDDYNIPVTIFGRFRYTGKMFDESGTAVWCQVMELETNKKS